MGEPVAADLNLITEDVLSADTPLAEAPPIEGHIGGRYRVLGELGRGGMAIVYRVLDEQHGRELALKRLAIPSSHATFAVQAAAFEREFHALVQLAHPRIIAVHDFGADDSGRFYTMELLDGGDLRQHAPMPWREACALFYDVCSSLSLLHSRRLVHRDISPRNVHRARDGKAKLIDFGAMVPLGSTAPVLGTPPFVPPEVLHRSTLDGRTDLFSLGATLYYTLTGCLAYSARDFAGLRDAWAQRPAPPSAMAKDIPAGLDALVLSLVSLDPAQRPRTAFEVMQKLAALAGLAHVEAADVSQAYLSTPTLVGREPLLARQRVRVEQARAGRGGSTLLRGAPGSGRSRLLDACALDAKLQGALVLRVNAHDALDAPLAVGQMLAAQVADAIPDALGEAMDPALRETLCALPDERNRTPGRRRGAVLRDVTGRAGDRAKIQDALTRWLSRVAKLHTFVVLVDDLERVDEASLALLGALALGAHKRRVHLVMSVSTLKTPSGPLAVIERESENVDVLALDRGQTEALLESVFGDVPQLSLLSERLFEAAGGNPRETLELVDILVTRRVLRYEGGCWVLPASLSLSELPSTAAEACQRRVAALSPLAVRLAQLFALAWHASLSRADLALATEDRSASEVDLAVTELLTARVLIGEGHGYQLARQEWRAPLEASLEPMQRDARHAALACVCAADGAHAVERVHHLLRSRSDREGLDLLTQLLGKTSGESHGLLSLCRLSASQIAAILDEALTTAERVRASARQTHEIRRSLMAISVVTDEAHYGRAAPALLRQLRHDAGLDIYDELAETVNTAQRVQVALMRAAQRYAATPEAERVCDPQTAIRALVYFVVISIAQASRTQDCELVRSLPALLEPFAPLSPLVHAVWQNAIATRETIADNLPEHAHARWLRVLDALEKITTAEAAYVAPLRAAIHYGLGLIEARSGFADAAKWADYLDDQPSQRVSAMSLRRVAHLHRGDAISAERRRKSGELLALQTNVRPMFYSTLGAELTAYALACDLTGVREVLQAIQRLAERFSGWEGWRLLAEGYFEQICGRLEDARRAFERGLAVSEPAAHDPKRCTGAWIRLEVAQIELLIQLDEASEARARGVQALARCTEQGIGLAALPIRRALALAEAKLGDYAGASERIEGVAEQLRAFQIRGLELGATYEARTRIAIWFHDTEAIETYGRLTAEEYRYGQGSALGARYERLLDEAQKCGVATLPKVADIPASLEHSMVTHSKTRTADG